MALVMENKGIKILSAIEFFVLVAHFCMPGLMKTRVGLNKHHRCNQWYIINCIWYT